MSMSYSLPEEGLRLDAAVWYPTNSRRSSSTVRMQGWSFRAVKNAAPAEGRFPLVLVSHPSAGSRFTAWNTAMALAGEGFVVAALTHPMDNLDHMPYVLTWDLFERRCKDLSRLADLILVHERLAPVLDAGRVGVLGYGAGATTALLLGGALPDCSGWENFCEDTVSSRDPYCNKWAHGRISTELCPRLPLTRSLADTRVKAVCAVAPRFAMLMTDKALRHFHPALLLVTTDTQQTHERKEIAGLERRFPIPPEHFRVRTESALSLLAECPEEMRDELPDMCLTVDSDVRSSLHRQFMPVLVHFLNSNLALGTPRFIPAPPDLAPAVEERPAAPEKKAAGKQRRRTRQQTDD
ncbi:MAG: hypothetical protein Q4F72_00440 [Desulfovibrionaceae bacterium]|nr:hypothetical protein [Desulfovibrionaceae bacterium]